MMQFPAFLPSLIKRITLLVKLISCVTCKIYGNTDLIDI